MSKQRSDRHHYWDDESLAGATSREPGAGNHSSLLEGVASLTRSAFRADYSGLPKSGRVAAGHQERSPRLVANAGPAGAIPGRRATALLALLGAVLFLTGCGTAGAPSSHADDAAPGGSSATAPATDAEAPPSRAPEVRMPGGTAISVRLLSSISSETAHPGDEVDAELAAPLVVDGQTLYEKGTRARVRVMSVQASGRLKNPGFLKITFAAVKRSNGSWEQVETVPISARGQSHKKRNTTLIGGGAAVGAVIGAIASGGKGAAIGAASGAAAGTAGAYATGRTDVSFSVERVLRFKTAKEVVFAPQTSQEMR